MCAINEGSLERRCIGSAASSLFANAISTKISHSGPNNLKVSPFLQYYHSLYMHFKTISSPSYIKSMQTAVAIILESQKLTPYFFLWLETYKLSRN